MSTVLSHFDASFHPLMDDDSAQIFCKDSRLFADFAQVKKGKIFVNPDKVPRLFVTNDLGVTFFSVHVPFVLI